MGNKLSSSDKHHVKQAFDYFDKDSDGKLTQQEVMEALKISGEDAATIIRTCDTNKDGVISFDEFCRVIEKRFLEAFHLIDEKDSLGLFTKTELKRAYERAGVNISEHQIDAYFSALDVNNDNLISLKEFIIGSFVTFIVTTNKQEKKEKPGCI